MRPTQIPTADTHPSLPRLPLPCVLPGGPDSNGPPACLPAHTHSLFDIPMLLPRDCSFFCPCTSRLVVSSFPGHARRLLSSHLLGGRPCRIFHGSLPTAVTTHTSSLRTRLFILQPQSSPIAPTVVVLVIAHKYPRDNMPVQRAPLANI